MQRVRHLLAQRRLATFICAATLLLKLLVPAGYMIGNGHDRITITVCSGTGPATMTMEIPETRGDTAAPEAGHRQSQDHGKAALPCAFSGLSAMALGAIDPILLAALIAFVLALGPVLAILPVSSRPAYLRPPLRGPPAYL